jgi:hypothetical protein
MSNELDIEPGTDAAEVAADSRSLLDRIKSRRDEREDVLTIDIPSWDGDLQAKYRVVDRAEIEKMVRRIRIRSTGNGNTGSQADTDFLINACVGVIAVDDETNVERPLTSGYTMELAEMLGRPEITTPRELVAYLFKGNTIALGAHAIKVARWMQDTTKPVEDPQ